MPKLEFSHRKTVYTFIGDSVPPPTPGSYDVAAYTPPTNKIYTVAIQQDGIWSMAIGLPPVVYCTGDGAVSSKAFAESVILKHAPEFNSGTSK